MFGSRDDSMESSEPETKPPWAVWFAARAELIGHEDTLHSAPASQQLGDSAEWIHSEKMTDGPVLVACWTNCPCLVGTEQHVKLVDK